MEKPSIVFKNELGDGFIKMVRWGDFCSMSCPECKVGNVGWRVSFNGKKTTKKLYSCGNCGFTPTLPECLASL